MAVHARMVAEFGGAAPLKNKGLLESAIALPSAQFKGKFLHENLPAMGAAYLFHICRNHPFVDGNKRTALAVAEIFLNLNGLRLEATDAQLEAVTLGVAEGRPSKGETLVFFRDHTRA